MSEIDILDDSDKQGTRKLVDTTKILLSGIFSVILVTVFGVFLAVITINLARPQIREFNRHPTLYTKKSYNMVRIGYYCAIGGLIARVLFIIIMIALFQ